MSNTVMSLKILKYLQFVQIDNNGAASRNGRKNLILKKKLG